MKKFFSLLIPIVILASAFSFSASRAQAAGLITFIDGRFVWGKGVVFVFEASGYKNKDLKGASIFAGSNDHKLSCSSNKEEGRILCVVNAGLTEYAGETGVIYLARQIFYVIIPDMGPQLEDSGTDPDDEHCTELMEEEDLCTDPGDPGDPATGSAPRRSMDESVRSSRAENCWPRLREACRRSSR